VAEEGGREEERDARGNAKPYRFSFSVIWKFRNSVQRSCATLDQRSRPAKEERGEPERDSAASEGLAARLEGE